MGVPGDGRGDAGDGVGDLRRRRGGAFLRPRGASLVLLAACFVGYVGFHVVRAGLSVGWFRDSFPSLLAPVAMFAVVDLTPGVRFRSRRAKVAILAATTAVAAGWLEGVVPRLTSRATGSLGDAVAMAVGFGLFCAYDVAFGRRFDG